ncbi:hypothetical protein PMZ80_008680 [Knufia obscura]|uniref:chitin synthase n=1 Tax=Knufia obscura TaxID=1635080 RepID=A0ABR0RFH9_9EURO|nr:hypothetical protein PMZ80_008680 [Knufia obscura]
MQCPVTPPAKMQNGWPTPRTTGRDSGTARKRSTFRRPFSDLCNFDAGFDLNDDTPSKTTASAEASSPSARRYNRASKARITDRFSGATPLENVFLDTEPESQPENSAAALRFHSAAKKLRLASLPPVADDENTIDADSAQLWIQASSAFSPERASRRFSRGSDTARLSNIYKSPLEQDITSARKARPYALEGDPRNNLTPLKGRERNSSESSKAKVGASPPGAESTVQQKASYRNFSRSVRRPQLYTIRDSNIQSAASSVPGTASSTLTLLSSEGTFVGGSASLQAPPSVKSHGESDEAGKELQQRTKRTSKVGEELMRQQRHNSLDIGDNLTGSCEQTPESGRPAAEPHQDEPTSPQSINLPDHVRESFDSAVTDSLGDKRLQLSGWEIWGIRLVFTLFVFTVNIALGLAYLGSFKHPYLLAILVFMKSKDILSTLADITGMLRNFAHNKIWPPKQPKSKWILSLVCAYAETEEQILKTVKSLAKCSTRPHKQAICIILDGKPRDILSKMSMVKATVTLPYTTWKRERGDLNIHAGLVDGTAVILMEKVKNAGKKDSLILGHDLFNYPREDMPHSTTLLRQQLWKTIIPSVITDNKFTAFDYIFCTDADSTIHDHCLRKLADALSIENNAIAGCGVLFAEFDKARTEYSMWHLFQQFQYTFGQYVRRQAESMWGRVTCLPGCVTMIVVRPEMGPALSEYATPVTSYNIFHHQVQYLGTDRRLTWCMISQNKHLRTIFVPDALSETVVPSSLSHYLSQRRRWASNAYFNDFWLTFGPQQRLITRLFALIDLVRLTLVFYRVFNTAYFLHGLITNFYVIKIIPTLIVTKTPAAWYLVLVLVKEPLLRKRVHKIILGMCINQVISPILSVIVFVNVLLHIGSNAWGKTGVSTQGPAPGTVTASLQEPKPSQPWTPKRLAKSVKTAIRGPTPKPQSRKPVSDQPPTANASRKQRSNTLNARTKPQPSTAKRRAPSFDANTESTTPTASTSSLDTVGKARSRAPSLSCTPAPAGRIRQNSHPTPLSLLRRTPRHRERAHSKLTPLIETPTKPSSQASSSTKVDHDE